MKIAQLARLFTRRPEEALMHIERVFDSALDSKWIARPSYQADELFTVVEQLQRQSGLDLTKYFDEPALAEIDDEVRQAIAQLPAKLPFALNHNADFLLARLCYALCRAFRIKIGVETGICYGVTSSYLLKALEVNQVGELHSIDMPPLAGANGDFVGVLVPARLRNRWIVHRGPSRRLLPRILAKIGSVDFFLHDSLHTYRNMKQELAVVTPHLSRPAIVVSDDVEGNPAFMLWSQSVQPQYCGVVKEAHKSGLMGVALFTDVSHPGRVALSRSGRHG